MFEYKDRQEESGRWDLTFCKRLNNEFSLNWMSNGGPQKVGSDKVRFVLKSFL